MVQPERPETPVGLKAAGYVIVALVALVVLRWVFNLVQFAFSLAILVAIGAAVVFVVRQVKQS